MIVPAPAPTSSPALPSDWAPLVERLRLAHVQRASIDIDSIDLGAPRPTAADSVVIDAHNGLVDVDARLSLATVARVLARRGWLLPLLRPLPTTPLWRLATRAPFVVDTVCQQALLLTSDGDLTETPAAPRHAAGPSLLHATTTPLPFALLVRARLRVLSTAHTALWREEHPTTAAVAARLRGLVDESRAFGADAYGTTLWVLGGSSLAPSAAAASSPPAPIAVARARRPGWSSSRSVRPGDVDGIAAALDARHRVAAVPYLQRAAVLERARPQRALADVATAAAALAAALAGPRARLPLAAKVTR